MASYEYEGVKEERYGRFQMIVKAWIGCLGSFSFSLVGGLILVWWELNYHPTNDQQWMVPVGLILFVTPLIVWLAVFISDHFCSSTDHYMISTQNSPGKPFHDPER